MSAVVRIHTVGTSAIWFDKRLGDLAILNLQSIAFAAHASENGGSIKSNIERFGKLRRCVGKETNLDPMSINI